MEIAMYTSKPSALPVNPILAAQQIVSDAGALTQIKERPIGSSLCQELTLQAPTLKRNYGSLDLSRMMSYSSSSSSVSTPTDAVFPMHCDFIEQDVSPASSVPNSPVLEFSIRHETQTTNYDPEPLGVIFGPGLTPEFVPANEASDYLDFLDTPEDCDSLGHFAESSPTLSTLDVISGRSYPSVWASGSDSTLELWRPEHTTGSLLVNPGDLASSDVIELSCAELRALDSILNSPKPAFLATSPRIMEGAWGLPSSTLDSAVVAEITSPAIGPGSFEVMQWIPTIASLALVASLVMGPAYWWTNRIFCI
ncbi:hypothetical protein FRC11_000130 [Ceratobasidium sp. 423]|nr:hypothetical protein FRC11_000130 [Ceratobasidium sp. 423]